MMKRILTVMSVLLIILSLASCSDDGKNTDSNTKSSKTYATLQEYCDHSGDMQSADADASMTMKVYPEGNVLVYDYTYNDTIPETDLPAFKAALDETMEGSKSSFVSLANKMQAQVDESIRLKVIYRNSDAKVITERVFDPE